MANTHTLSATDIGAHLVTLTANTVETFSFPRDLDRVDVISDGTADIYYTLDGSDPTVAGSKTYRIPAGGPVVDTRAPGTPGDSSTIVKLISAGKPVVSVQRGS